MKKLALLAVAALLVACGGPGDEYLGRWIDSSDPQSSLKIARNGNGFLVEETRPPLLGRGEPRVSTTPAVLKDGLLRMETALGPVPIAHVEASDTLTVPGLLGTSTEYRRAKK